MSLLWNRSRWWIDRHSEYLTQFQTMTPSPSPSWKETGRKFSALFGQFKGKALANVFASKWGSPTVKLSKWDHPSVQFLSKWDHPTVQLLNKWDHPSVQLLSKWDHPSVKLSNGDHLTVQSLSKWGSSYSEAQ